MIDQIKPDQTGMTLFSSNWRQVNGYYEAIRLAPPGTHLKANAIKGIEDQAP
jgi:hypothetical protein